MCPKPDIARLEFIKTLIDDIDLILKRHNTIQNTLNDREGFHALMMCFLQIGETLNRIESEEIKNLLPVSSAYAMRNVIAHNYMGISQRIIQSTVTENIPELKIIVIKLIDSLSNQ